MDAIGFLIVNGIEDEERRAARRERVYAVRVDVLEYDEIRCIGLYRVTRDIVRMLVRELRPHFLLRRRRSTFSVEERILAALRFFAIGGYQRSVGQCSSMSQRSVSRALRDTYLAINHTLLHRWVKFPTTRLEQAAVKARFMEKYNFPGVLGCIDGTHVYIVPPPRDHPEYPEHHYVNHHSGHSLNVQLVCDANMTVLSAVTNFAGRNHDNFIWRYSRLREGLLQQHMEGRLASSWLLGDSGYMLEPFMMIPCAAPPPDSAQLRYNNAHAQVRNIIERVNGVLKSRWRCLRRDRTLHYSPPVASHIVSACLVLHNIANAARIPLPLENEPEQLNRPQPPLDVPIQHVYHPLHSGQVTRQALLREHFGL